MTFYKTGITIPDHLKKELGLVKDDNGGKLSDDILSVVDNVQDDITEKLGKRNELGEIEITDYFLKGLEFIGSKNRKHIRVKCDTKSGKVLCMNLVTEEHFHLDMVNISKGGLGLISKDIIGVKGDKLELLFISKGRNLKVKSIIRYMKEIENKGVFYYGVEFLDIDKHDSDFIDPVNKDRKKPDQVIDQDTNNLKNRYPRVKLESLGLIDTKVRCKNMGNGNFSENDIVIDINENGIGISSTVFIKRKEGTIVDLEFLFNNRNIFQRGIIVHMGERDSKNKVFIGIKFIDILREDKKHIMETIYANVGLNIDKST